MEKAIKETKIITPRIASMLLEKIHGGQRTVKENVVKKYASEMSSGNWTNTGEPIIILVDGTVGDGQHRLLAIVNSGVSIEMDIRYGVPVSAFKMIDRGSARSSRDRMRAIGLPEKSAEIAAFYFSIVKCERCITDSMLEQFAIEHEVACSWVDEEMSVMPSAFRLALVEYQEKDSTACLDFVRSWKDDDFEVKSGVWLLKRYMATKPKNRTAEFYKKCKKAMELHYNRELSGRLYS